jgi:hypothetical protein
VYFFTKTESWRSDLLEKPFVSKNEYLETKSGRHQVLSWHFFRANSKEFFEKNFTPFQPLFSGKTVCLCCPHFQQKSSNLIFLLSFLSLASSKKLSRAGLPDLWDKIYQNWESVTTAHKRFQIAIKLEQMATKYTRQMVIHTRYQNFPRASQRYQNWGVVVKKYFIWQPCSGERGSDPRQKNWQN